MGTKGEAPDTAKQCPRGQRPGSQLYRVQLRPRVTMVPMKPSVWPLRATVLAVFAFMLVLHDRVERSSAADTETVTWGATDPTWAPGSDHIAFSLFGSIWRVPSSGGDADQITTSAGYHAHPAWSPTGDRIAFIRGDPPRGRIPNIYGSLMLVDVATAKEKEIATPYPTAGTPAWSPDGTRIVCGLRVNAAGSLLHAINVTTGEVRRLQDLPRGSAAERWIDAGWNPKHDEIYFTAQRGGPAQIWSLPPGDAPFIVQMPLTRYRKNDIALLQSLSTVPDGSGVVYSGVVTNGKGDYELYRLSREGGDPVSITNTSRDEFSPAVSPDGRLIAHVSNHLGNIDLFTSPLEGGEKKHVRITSLKFQRPAGFIRVQVRDELGETTPVQLYVRAADGKAYCPSGSPIHYYPLDPGHRGGYAGATRSRREGFFIASGDDVFPAPAGRLRLIAQKGLEYRIAEREVEVIPGETTEVLLTMERWTNWNQRGWYSGENHVHANYHGSYYLRPKQLLGWLQAMDLNVANMAVANAFGAFVHDKEFFRGAVDPISTNRHILYWGQEYRNNEPLGHMGFLNINKLVPPFYTSLPGSNSPYDFPLNTMAALDAQRQGGLVTYMHPMNATVNDVFDDRYSAREVPVTAALGALNSVDVLPLFEGNPYELWYRLLNSGFRIAPGAGTDAFPSYRGIYYIPGMARQYVEVGPVMSWDRWIARYREGRNFVTSGPLLKFEVNGNTMGSEIRVVGGQSYRAKLATEVTSRAPLRLIEFIQNGKVIESKELDATTHSVRLEKEVVVDDSCWFAVRVEGRPARGVQDDGIPRAHSGPVYVHFDGKPTLIQEDVALMMRWLDRLWNDLEYRNNFGSPDNRERALKMFQQAREHYRSKLLSQP